MKYRLLHIIFLLLILIGCDFKTSSEYFNDGNMKSNNGDYEGAIKDFTLAINKNPNDYESYTNRGADYAAIGRYKEAISDYNKAVELNPSNIMAYFNRGNLKSKLNDFNGAIEDYNQAIKLKGGENLYVEIHDNDFLGIRSTDVRMENIRLQSKPSGKCMLIL
ncbi:tetratricopeptide repeat protein [Cytophagaceae bacterium ABcell3]|nr:tetratricopeptide repeat protein [Cytophagaceae bacterium ABcell3]